ncbi:GAF domain-containing protein [Sphingobacterium sp. JB170]|uniref:GAF domain-containing protein n=1 Tax=Sphingobacterium sp. JB170 TaxID=1434842 RepID=UPI00097EA98B|nr:GAF domain-containing protein [Sphingobacterium sp. JB170]SJN33678.1 GAF domain-containing protein, involved in signal transduction [Sphingobacterium sp. JB170]
MAEDLSIATGTKEQQYNLLTKQIAALVEGESDTIANLANIAAALKEQFNFWWVGFYLVKHDQLVLGPFQGPVACTRIAYGRGVCGTAWKEKKTLIVDDVDNFPGHIACSSLSKSEIVIPIILDDKCVAVLDVDSENLSHFDQIDAAYLEVILQKVDFSKLSH